jgi:hypothetical protein
VAPIDRVIAFDGKRGRCIPHGFLRAAFPAAPPMRSGCL